MKRHERAKYCSEKCIQNDWHKRNREKNKLK